jgi:Ca2+-transporting ATPase
MQSLDVLGQIQTLALDKTGTITRNQMKVEKIYAFDDTEIYVTGDGYEPKGTNIYNTKQIDINSFNRLKFINY